MCRQMVRTPLCGLLLVDVMERCGVDLLWLGLCCVEWSLWHAVKCCLGERLFWGKCWFENVVVAAVAVA